MSKIIVVTSGKGGVGKTTSTAALGAALAMRGHKTVVVDFDVGLRNLDMILGCERRVVFDFIDHHVSHRSGYVRRSRQQCGGTPADRGGA